MKVKVVSCEKESGIDLLAEQPFLSHCEEGKRHLWDGFHSGFPCTTFTKLRFRPSPGYPGPVRTKQHPHGLPDLDDRRRRECDEGTLHAARSAHLADLILGESRPDRIRPSVTMENPPPSDHPEHLSAWELEEIDQVVKKHQMTTVDFNTCAFQAHIPIGQRNFKPQRFVGTLLKLEDLCGLCPCGRDAKHVAIIGKEKSAASGEYPRQLCVSYAIKLLIHFTKIASLEFYNLRREALEEELEELNKEEQRRKEEKAAMKSNKPKKKEKKEKQRSSKTKPPKEKKKKQTKEAKQEKTQVPVADVTKDDEYTYEYYTEEEGSETEVQQDAKEPASSSLDWKGGLGDYGMLKESKSKKQDPRALNYLGGMRDPTTVVEGRPTALNLGIRVFAAWERFTSSHPLALETAAEYGTEACKLDDKTIEDWRGELRKVLGSRGKHKTTLRSRWEYQSPLVLDLFEAWTRRSGDPDLAICDWIENGVPLGINEEIVDHGIFPPSDKPEEAEAMTDAAAQMQQGLILNYTSVRENREDAEIEARRLMEKNFCMKVTEEEVRERFSQGTISKLAILVKTRADGSKKRRLIIDLRRSGGNSKSKLKEKLILPRMQDAVQTLRAMHELKPTFSGEEKQQHWQREMVLIDVSDAFPHLGIRSTELEHCLTPDVETSGYLLFKALLFGFKTAPLLWSRTAAFVARCLQASVPKQLGQHQVYLDDSFWVLQGTLNKRNQVLGFILYSMAALGLNLSVSKGERGAALTWAGVEYRLVSQNEVLLTLPVKFLEDLLQRLEAWKGRGMAPIKELRAVCGKVAWLTGVLPRARWILRVLYANLASREQEINSGQEERRRQSRSDDRIGPKSTCLW